MNLRKRGKAWPRHTPGRKETASINLKNRLVPVVTEVPGIPIPLKRKYLTYRAYMQAPVGSPSQAPKNKGRSFFPLSRRRIMS